MSSRARRATPQEFLMLVSEALCPGRRLTSAAIKGDIDASPTATLEFSLTKDDLAALRPAMARCQPDSDGTASDSSAC